MLECHLGWQIVEEHRRKDYVESNCFGNARYFERVGHLGFDVVVAIAEEELFFTLARHQCSSSKQPCR